MQVIILKAIFVLSLPQIREAVNGEACLIKLLREVRLPVTLVSGIIYFYI